MVVGGVGLVVGGDEAGERERGSMLGVEESEEDDELEVEAVLRVRRVR